MNILILYFSGVGNTKMVAEKIYTQLKNGYDVSLISIEEINYEFYFDTYDALVIGFPTIHTSPAQPMMNFINGIRPLRKTIPVFLFTTCGLYSANTLRIFAKKCREQNLTPILNRSYRCSATDGTLLAPFMSIWFRHEKKLDDKVTSDCDNFMRLLKIDYQITIPRFKFYSILNYPNKKLGERFPSTIYIHKESCITCGKCIAACPVTCFTKDHGGYPIIQADKCIHCYRCIHHCPKKALSLSKKRMPSKTLNNK